MKLRSTKILAEAIYESTKGKSGAELSQAIDNSVSFMDKNQLLGKKKEILAHLEKIIDKDENILRAKVKSANILSKKTLEELGENLKKKYKAKEVQIDSMIDEKLIDGFKIEVNDEIIDFTLSHKLHRLQEHLIKN